MRTLLVRALLGALALAVVTPIVAVAGAATKITPDPQIYLSAMHDALAMRSFHEVSTVVSKGFVSTDSEDALIAGGIERVTVVEGTKTATTIPVSFGFVAQLAAGHLYLNADQDTLEGIMGLSAFNGGFNAGRWLVVPKKSSSYNELSYGIDLSTGLAQIALGGSISVGAETRYKGVEVLPLTSSTGLHASESNGTEPGKFTLYVTTGRHPLPVAEIAQDLSGTTPQKITFSFSRWDERLSVTAPSGARPLP